MLDQVAHYLTTFAAVLHDFGVHEEPTHTIHRLNADRVAHNDFYAHLVCMPITGKADEAFTDEVLRRYRAITRELIRTGERLTPAILPPCPPPRKRAPGRRAWTPASSTSCSSPRTTPARSPA